MGNSKLKWCNLVQFDAIKMSTKIFDIDLGIKGANDKINCVTVLLKTNLLLEVICK